MLTFSRRNVIHKPKESGGQGGLWGRCPGSALVNSEQLFQGLLACHLHGMPSVPFSGLWVCCGHAWALSIGTWLGTGADPECTLPTCTLSMTAVVWQWKLLEEAVGQSPGDQQGGHPSVLAFPDDRPLVHLLWGTITWFCGFVVITWTSIYEMMFVGLPQSSCQTSRWPTSLSHTRPVWPLTGQIYCGREFPASSKSPSLEKGRCSWYCKGGLSRAKM